MNTCYSCLALLFAIINLLPVALSCDNKTELSGTINYTVAVKSTKCWIIVVPSGSYTRLRITEFTSRAGIFQCRYTSLVIEEEDGVELANVCPTDKTGVITGMKNVKITLDVDRAYQTSLTIVYKTESSDCNTKNPFRCSDHVCITEDKVCDGRKDCENGADEEGCPTGIAAVKGVNTSRENGIKWLNSRRVGPSGWGLNTHRAIIALYLADETYFNTGEPEKELIVKQLALQATLRLINDATNQIAANELSMFVNALTVTCYDPIDFYGNDLLDLLYKRSSYSAPAYLTLSCNQKWKLSKEVATKLMEEFFKDPSSSLPLDIQAMAVMALSCLKNKENGFGQLEVADAEKKYTDTIDRMINRQKSDGSFGSPYTTALVTQALLSAAQENNGNWNLKLAVENLMNKLNSSSVDLLLTYFTLPILNNKSLTNIANVNCPNNRKSDIEAIDIPNAFNDEITIDNSLHKGDQNETVLIHSSEDHGNSIHEIIKKLVSSKKSLD